MKIKLFTFLVIKWSEDGNTVLDEKMLSVRRTQQHIAKNYLQTKYPTHFVECWN